MIHFEIVDSLVTIQNVIVCVAQTLWMTKTSFKKLYLTSIDRAGKEMFS